MKVPTTVKTTLPTAVNGAGLSFLGYAVVIVILLAYDTGHTTVAKIKGLR
ncbi:MAG TPA: hypothetical protein VMS08_03875 [Candidatus Saccharimonadia bacterium]|nr:hypothetical protein [Candidatus Saccharimonadia bacterium]